ncbi:MAG: histidine phosphatase family protein [Gammaproteobacteria bacterium]|jgi:phosphohistidine phosphatase|nr:histidine phosphatase family protein [Gammaproteobacteria bacterium]
MRLWILRHARAEPNSDSGRDRDRSLSPAGQRCCNHLNQVLDSADCLPLERVLVSPARRTRETAALVLRGLDAPTPEATSRLWMAELSTLIDVIDTCAGDSLMLVGHNPGLELLVKHLGGQLPVVGLKPGTLVVLEFDRPMSAGPARTLQVVEPNEST